MSWLSENWSSIFGVIVTLGLLKYARDIVKAIVKWANEKIETTKFVKNATIEAFLDDLARKAVSFVEKKALEAIDRQDSASVLVSRAAGKMAQAKEVMRSAASKHGVTVDGADAERRLELAHAEMEAAMARSDFIAAVNRSSLEQPSEPTEPSDTE